MAENCIFCQVIAGKAPATIIYQDEQVTAFQDQSPAAPVHILIVPNRHIHSLNQANEDDEQLLGHIMLVARGLAEQKGIQQSGYRLILNTGSNAGQTVFHLHFHLMGGQRLPGIHR